MKRVVLVLAASVALGACAPALQGVASEPARIERVVDGDTVIAIVGGARVRVRLIGVDTPETVKPGAPVECFGPEASAFTKRTLNGEAVTLAYDRRRLDRYGRTLAYVTRVRDGMFVNLELVRAGYARTLDVPPDDRFAGELSAAEQAAKRRRLGLWRACAPFAGGVGLESPG